MAQDQIYTRIRNITFIILAVLAVLYITVYFLFPFDISLAVIISSLLAFIVFAATLVYYRRITQKKMVSAARSIMISFVAKILFLGGSFYLIVRLDLVNMMVFAVSFVIFFTIFLNMEIFMIYKKLLFKQEGEDIGST